MELEHTCHDFNGLRVGRDACPACVEKHTSDEMARRMVASASVVCKYTEEDMREAIRLAYEDAARIVMEPRGATPEKQRVWLSEVTGLAERIVWRGGEFPSHPGTGALPEERLTAHARGLPVPTRKP